METTYNIPVQSIREVTKYLTKLQRRAERSKQVIFKFSFDDEVKTHTFRAENVEEQGDVIMSYKYRVLRVDQNITVHEGWVPIAKLDITEKAMRVYDVYKKEIETLGDKMWTKHCDHCGHNKIVHTAFVMQNGDRFMKVGKGCMRELAPASASQIAREFDIYSQWSDYLASMAPQGDGSFSNRSGGGGVSIDYVYEKSKIILAMRAALEKTSGNWITSTYNDDHRSSDYGRVTNKGHRTFDFVQDFMNGKYYCLLPDQAYVDSVNAQVDLCLSKYSNLLKEEQLTGLQAWVANDKAKVIDVFLIKAVQGILARQAEKEKMKTSEFQGKVGEKMNVTVELVSTRHGTGASGFGWTLWIFKDDQGNMYKKFGEVNDRFKDKETGLYRFCAPIKGHETYEEIKYTTLGGPLSKVK